jgi:hypothetical protein
MYVCNNLMPRAVKLVPNAFCFHSGIRHSKVHEVSYRRELGEGNYKL